MEGKKPTQKKSNIAGFKTNGGGSLTITKP